MQPGLYNTDGFTPFDELLEREILRLEDGTLLGNYYDFDYMSLEEIEKVVEVIKRLNPEIIIPDYKDEDNDEIAEFFDRNFSDTHLMGKLVLPDTVTNIGHEAFCSCIALEEVVLPETVKNLDRAAFASCIELKKVNFPEELKIIGRNCFYNCPNLKGVNLRNVEEIRYGAFYDCVALTDVLLSDKLKELGTYVFYNCKKLTTIEIPDSIEEIKKMTFSQCKNLKNVKLSKNLKEIKKGAFEYCKLEQIEIPDNVEKIEQYAFRKNPLTQVVIPIKTLSCAADVFEDCEKLKDIIYLGKIETLKSGDFPKGTRSIDELEIEDMLSVLKINSFKDINNVYKINKEESR